MEWQFISTTRVYLLYEAMLKFSFIWEAFPYWSVLEFLKFLVLKIRFIELDFLSISNRTFSGYTSSKNLVWNRQQIVCKTWFSKLGFWKFKYRSIGGYAFHASWTRIRWQMLHMISGLPNKKGQKFVGMLPNCSLKLAPLKLAFLISYFVFRRQCTEFLFAKKAAI